jgi:hypothetical protein
VIDEGKFFKALALESTYCQGVIRVFYGVYRVSEADFGRNLARLCIQIELLESEKPPLESLGVYIL